MPTQCQSCFGVYEPIGLDGLPYFHVCPPVACARATRDGRVGLVPFSKLLGTDLVQVQRGKEMIEVPVSDVLPDDQRLGDQTVARLDGRDETVVAFKNARGEKVTRIRAEGKGAIEIDVPPAAALPVLEAP